MMIKSFDSASAKHAFLDAALDCIITIDQDNRIVEFNRSAETTFGYSAAEIIGSDLSNAIIPEKFREAHRNGFKRFLKTGVAHSMDRRLELSAIRRNGDEFPIELTVTQLQKDPPLFTAFIRDITARKQIEKSLLQSQEELEAKVKARTSDLAKSEERFRLMVAAVKDYAILMLDSDGHIITWNEGVGRLKGYSADEIIGNHFSIFYPEIDKINKKPEMEIREAIRTGRFEDEGFRVRKDGTTFWANVVITAVRNSKDELIGFSKVTRDLTLRKKYEDDLRFMRDDLAAQVIDRTKELSESRDQLSIIFKAIKDGITVLDRNGKYIFANEAGARMFGYDSIDAFLAATTEEIFDRFEVRDEFGVIFPLGKFPGRLALTGVVNPPETIIRFRYKETREERWALVNANSVFDENKNVKFAVSIFKDFTERKRAEDTTKYLDEASRVLISTLDYERALTEIAALAVPRMADWCVIEIKKEHDIYPRTIAVEHQNRDMIKFAKQYRVKYPKNWSESMGSSGVIRSGRSELYPQIPYQLIQQKVQDPDQLAMIRKFDIQSAMIVPLYSRKEVYGVITFYSAESGRQFTQDDLLFAEELARRASVSIENALLFAEAESERNKHASALAKMEKLAEVAESANQTKSLFLANMSHEIRTPLGAILGFTEFLNDSNLPQSERARYTNIIRRNGELLTQIIDDILDLSKVEAGHLDVEMIEVSIRSLLMDIAAVMNLRAREKGLDFTIQTDTSVPPSIYSDPTRLRQILINLIGNAIKFTENGFVKVVVKMSSENTLVFEVEDSGHGILPANRDRMFEWFTQADSSTTRKFGGTGLGLALSRRLARALGGDIVLADSSKVGTKFLISISLNLEKQQGRINSAIDLFTQDFKNTRPAVSAAKPFQGMRVLLVDDSDDNRVLIETILVRKGVEVSTAVNGQDGLEQALKQHFDIILMDMQMPVLDGFQATTELRKQGYQKPILALTAHAMKEEREKTKAAGCDAHLTKPIDVPKLFSMLSHYWTNDDKLDMQ